MKSDSLFNQIMGKPNANARHRKIPAISVIIPAYNCAPSLNRALQSVDQSLSYWRRQSKQTLSAEVIIVIDRATDDTYEVAREYIDQRDGFQNIPNPQNYGAGPSRNIGVRHSKGELIFFLDADDIYLEDHIHLCVDQMIKHPYVNYVHTL